MKHKVLMIAIAVALLLAPSANAALLSINGPTVVNPADGTFTFDVLLQSTDGISNLDFWGLGLALSPESGATFVGASASSDSNYVFYGNSYDYQVAPDGLYNIKISDATASGDGVTDYAGKLLATVEVDISGAAFGDYSVDFYGLGNWTIFGDSEFNMDVTAALDSPYNFTVGQVPLPAAVWLLGSGLFGLVAVRRRK